MKLNEQQVEAYLRQRVTTLEGETLAAEMKLQKLRERIYRNAGAYAELGMERDSLANRIKELESYCRNSAQTIDRLHAESKLNVEQFMMVLDQTNKDIIAKNALIQRLCQLLASREIEEATRPAPQVRLVVPVGTQVTIEGT